MRAKEYKQDGCWSLTPALPFPARVEPAVSFDLQYLYVLATTTLTSTGPYRSCAAIKTTIWPYLVWFG